MIHTLFFTVASGAIGYCLYLFFYWRQMHALVSLEHGVLDAPHILLVLLITGFILGLF